MKPRILVNMLKQGLQGVSRNRSMSFVSILSISIVLLILGVVLVLVLSINNVARDTNKMMDRVDVFLNYDLDEAGIRSVADQIEAIGGISSIRFRSKAEGLEDLKKKWGDQAWLLDGYEAHNPLPNAFAVQVADIKDVRGVVDRIRALPGVLLVNFFADEIEQMLTISRYIKLGGLAIVAFLAFVSIFLISNTIKLAVNSRRNEISIMKWVGATNGYIKGPFFIEGVILGLIGALLATIIMYFGYHYFYIAGKSNVTNFLASALIAPSQLYGDMTMIFLTLGVGIGALGSLISLKKFLRV